MQIEKRVNKGDVYWADLGVGKGSEQSGVRPVVVISNDIGNRFSPTVTVAMITAQEKTEIPTHMSIKLKKPSTIMLEQVKTIDKTRLGSFIYKMTPEMIEEMDEKLLVSFGIGA
jgi:mRNA interferase MazF